VVHEKTLDLSSVIGKPIRIPALVDRTKHWKARRDCGLARTCSQRYSAPMHRRGLLELAKRLLSVPTAPYHEHAVRQVVLDFCREHKLSVEGDRAGNIIARYGRGGAPLVLMAHMDHPGFEALGGRRAEFLGGVPKEWFAGAPVRFGKVRTKVKRVLPGWPKRKLVELAAPVTGFGQWDVTRFAVRRGRLHATGIDDVLSVAVVLATLAECKRRRLKTHLWGAFTRAEEVGFHGAVELARAGKIPRRALVVSMEMSRERPWARIGDGSVVRVGDRMTIFDPMATYFFCEVARRSKIKVQRCLMDGGSTEATAFGGLGYRVGGLCLPLGNYHNIGTSRKVRAEFVSVSDLEGLLELAVAAAREWPQAGKIAGSIRQRIAQIRASAPRRLN
jgi:putative aminopeptidase FrvX